MHTIWYAFIILLGSLLGFVCLTAMVDHRCTTVVPDYSSSSPVNSLKSQAWAGTQSADQANARPVCYHCTSQEADFNAGAGNLRPAKA